MATDLCTTALDCASDFQTLLAGGLAVAAAGLGAWAVLRAANKPVAAADRALREERDRRRKFFGSVLAQNLSAIRSRSRQAIGMIRVLEGAEQNVNEQSRLQMRLTTHPILDDWQFVSLAPDALVRRLTDLQRVIADHNHDVERAGSFNGDAFRQSVTGRLDRIMGEANALRGLATLLSRGDELPHHDLNVPGLADA